MKDKAQVCIVRRSFRKIVEAKEISITVKLSSLYSLMNGLEGLLPIKLGEMRDEKISRNVSKNLKIELMARGGQKICI